MEAASRRTAPHIQGPDRRSFLKRAAAAATATIIPLPIATSLPAMAATLRPPERSLHLHLAHTGETFEGVYWSRGRYLPPALRQVDLLLRDRRMQEAAAIDPRLLDLLEVLQRRLDTRLPFEVLSGYRSPETNRALRLESRGVAKNSLHTKGMAVDIRVQDRDLRQVWRAASSLQAGGVGYYPRAGFIHLDVGEVRSW